jgi:hypothetical protein
MPILTLDELQASTIQADVAKEAYAQVEKRLSDLLETKKSFETRAASLLTGFTTLALALAGAGGTFFTSQPLVDHAPKGLPWAFFLAAIPLLLAAWSMLIALYPTLYGNLGTSPEVWLVRDVIDAPDNVVPPMQAYMVFHMNQRITDAEKANNKKAKHIIEGAFLATLSPLVLAGGILLAWAYA